MPLDQTYFDTIRIDVVKKKYYNASAVDALLSDIRRQALALAEENEQLKSQLSAVGKQKEEIGEALLSAKTIARQIIHDAQCEADQILAEAGERRRAIDESSDRILNQITEAAHQRRRELIEENERMEREMPRRLAAVEEQLHQRIRNSLNEAGLHLHSLLSDNKTPLAAPASACDEPQADDAEFESVETPDDIPADPALAPSLDGALETIARDIFSLDEDGGESPLGEQQA